MCTAICKWGTVNAQSSRRKWLLGTPFRQEEHLVWVYDCGKLIKVSGWIFFFVFFSKCKCVLNARIVVTLLLFQHIQIEYPPPLWLLSFIQPQPEKAQKFRKVSLLVIRELFAKRFVAQMIKHIFHGLEDDILLLVFLPHPTALSCCLFI